MPKVKIYAAGISNLTDARYFSAMGADYMGFGITANTNLEKIKEIIEWVEGPTFIGEWNEMDKNISSDIIEQTGIQTWLLPPFYIGTSDECSTIIPSILSVSDNIPKKTRSVLVKFDRPFQSVLKEEKEKIREMSTLYDVFLDLDVKSNELKEILDDFRPYSLVLRGGEEEKTGFKSYEEMDTIFELLQSMQ